MNQRDLRDSIARETVRDSEIKYRALFEGIEDAVWLIDDDLSSCVVNPAAARLFGYDSPSDLLDIHPGALSPEVQSDGLPSAQKNLEIKALLDAQGVAEFEWIHRRRDGSTFPARVRTRRMPLADRNFRVAIIRDLSEQRRSEETRRLTDAVFENTVEGILITDAAGRIVAVNPAFIEITGYRSEEVLGRNPRLMQSGRHGKDFYRNFWSSLNRIGRWQGELWNRRKNGEVYPGWMSVNTIRDHLGAVTNYVAIFSDITESYRTAEEIEYLSNHDPLTGLANGHLLRARLEQAMETAVAHGQRIGVFYVDIDRYNDVIASHGHASADEVLRVVGERLASTITPGDLAARLSDDTFVILAAVDDGVTAASSMTGVYLSVCAEPIALSGFNDLTLSASVGVALYPGDGTDASELLRNAASALLSAKRSGRRSIAFYRPEITAAAVRRLALEEALRNALDQGEFVLHYQPLVEPRSGIVRGAEALLRWQRGDELVMPGGFIGVVESCDLIVPLGFWIIDAVLQQIRAWQDAGRPAIQVSVNISEPQIAAGGLAEGIAERLQRYGVSPSQLQVEVIERVLLEDPDQALCELGDLRALGVSIALDDFGTGYSSLSYLTRFPVDCLKVDRSFISHLATDTRSAAIVRAILSMAHNLDIRTVAEGVEDHDQLRILTAEGCDLIQGYLVSRPVPPGDFARLIEGDGLGDLDRHAVPIRSI